MVEVADGTQLRVVASAAESVPPGASVWLHLPPERCRALAGEAEPATGAAPPGGNEHGVGRSPDGTFSRGRRARVAFPAASVRAAAPPPSAITPDLIAAAQKEGKVVWYTSIDLPVAEKIAKAFEAKYPGIAVRVERTGAERVFQRIGQECEPHPCGRRGQFVGRRALHRLEARRHLQALCARGRGRNLAAEHRDPDGPYASFRMGMSAIGFTTPTW